MTLVIAFDGQRSGQELEDDALFHGVMDFFLTGRQLGLAAAVNDVDVLGAHSLGAAGGVHGDVAAADDGHVLAVHDGGLGTMVAAEALHQVDTGQILVGGENAHQALAGDAGEHGQAGAGADEDGLELLFLEQLVDGEDLADDHVGLDLDAHLLEIGNFGVDDLLGQTELGDAVGQHAAGQMQSLEDGDVIALSGQLAGAGQAGRAGTDDSHAVAVGGSGLQVGDAVVAGPVGDEALQTADGDRLALDAADALALALALLGADTAGDGGQRVGGAQDLVSAGQIALADLGDEIRNGDVDGTSADAGSVLAVQAALGLFLSLLQGIALSDLEEVLVADVGLLLGHFDLGE